MEVELGTIYLEAATIMVINCDDIETLIIVVMYNFTFRERYLPTLKVRLIFTKYYCYMH